MVDLYNSSQGILTRLEGIKLTAPAITDSIQDREYGCAMLEVSKKIKDKILKWMEVTHVNPEHIFFDENYGFGVEMNPHITVMYGYHTDDLQLIFDSFSGYNKDHVDFQLGKIKKFSAKLYDVLHIEVKSADLVKLNTITRKSGLNITSLYPQYVPHITLVYFKSNAYKHTDLLVGDDFFEGIRDRSNILRITNSKNEEKKFTF